MERERSSEESDALERSTKKFKDNHCEGDYQSGYADSNANAGRSYKDKLVGDIPGAYEQAFGFDAFMEDEADSDCEESSLCEGMVAISLSKEEKIRIREPWGNAIIVKTFGRKVGFLFLSTKLRTMWMPTGRMDIIDLGNDFFLIKFELQTDLEVVLKGGPWFVGQQFLAIRKWEPEFKAEEASLSSVAVWVRLPGLPIEFYEPTMLKKIGRAIGPVLRIDSYTANGVRGRFARLCVQVNIEQPLINTVKIGKMTQLVQYEGINMLCFECGRLGHRKEYCPAMIRNSSLQSPKRNQSSSVPLESDDTGELLKESSDPSTSLKSDQVGKVYGEWMVVSRRKKSNGKFNTHSSGTRVVENRGQDVPPNASDTQAIPRDVVPDNRKDMKRKASTSSAGIDGHNGRKNQENQVKTSASQGLPKGKKGFSFKAANALTKPNQRNTVVDRMNNRGLGWEQNAWLPKTPLNTNNIFNFSAGSSDNDVSRLPVGEISKREGFSSGEINNCRNSTGPNGDHGMVRCRGNGGVEEYFPFNGGQCTAGLPSDDGRGMVHHSEPILALPDRPAKVSSIDVPAARASICATPLRKFSECLGGNISGTSDNAEENSAREAHRNDHHGKFVQGETSAVLNPFNSTHPQYLQQSGSAGCTEACGESFPGNYSGEERVETNMEVEGDR